MGNKIAVIGPESTGKSWLCQALAQNLGGMVVPEIARGYLEKLDQPYTFEDVEKIARLQMKAENEAWGKNPDWLFCDTSLLVIEVWMEHRFGYCPEWIRTQIRSGPGYHLFLLTFPDLGWTPDPLREHPDLQIHFWNIFKQKLEDMEYLWLDIRGRGNLRLENSLKLIHQQLDRQT